MKNIDIKSLIIGALLTSTVLLGMAAVSGPPGIPNTPPLNPATGIPGGGGLPPALPSPPGLGILPTSSVVKWDPEQIWKFDYKCGRNNIEQAKYSREHRDNAEGVSGPGWEPFAWCSFAHGGRVIYRKRIK